MANEKAPIDLKYELSIDETTGEQYVVIGKNGRSVKGDIVVPSEIDGHPVKRIAKFAFWRCHELTSVTISDGVEDIGDHAFFDCIGLTNVEIPESVKSIGGNAFGRCASLNKFAVADCNTAYSSVDGLLLSKDGKVLIRGAIENVSTHGSVTIPNGVTSIGDYAFWGCSGLTSVMIPDGVTSIGDHAFSDCSSLASVTIPDGVMNIGPGAFSGCSALASVTVPDGITHIGDETFKGCRGLKSVMMPSKVTSIGDSAFSGCSGLASMTIPEGVTYIGNAAFEDCCALKTVTIPSSVASIGESAFSGCCGLTSVAIPDGVKRIRKYTFFGCGELVNVLIPDSVTVIGGGAFEDCEKLVDVVVPRSVGFSGLNAFRNTGFDDWDDRGWMKVVEVKEPFLIDFSPSDGPSMFDELNVWPGVRFQIIGTYVDTDRSLYLCRSVDEEFEEAAVSVHTTVDDWKGYIKWFYLPMDLTEDGTVEVVEPNDKMKWSIFIEGVGERVVEAKNIDDVITVAMKTYDCKIEDLRDADYLSPLMVRRMCGRDGSSDGHVAE